MGRYTHLVFSTGPENLNSNPHDRMASTLAMGHLSSHLLSLKDYACILTVGRVGFIMAF